MGWLEGINRRGEWVKPLTSLPTADRACWKIFFEICWEAEIDDQIRRKMRAGKIENHQKIKLHRTATERSYGIPTCSGRRKHDVTAPSRHRLSSASQDFVSTLWRPHGSNNYKNCIKVNQASVRLCVKTPTSPPALQSWF